MTRMVISSDPIAVREALQALFDTFLMRTMPEAERGTAEIVLAEALNNIVEHAYASDSGEIEVTLRLIRSDLSCRIVDQGKPMPQDALPPGLPPELDPGQDLPEGGFGWHLIRTLARDLSYRRIDGRNQLTFRLNAVSPTGPPPDQKQ
ncbi:MAG: ATP-binding protein [Paracoccaceae bacterium]|nr:ATP-binding protein [Paracoccaceae bacterium]